MSRLPAGKNLIGSALKKARREAGLSQGDLAARCAVRGWDCSENTVSKIEAGFRCVADAELVALAEALGVKLLILLPDYPRLF